MARKIIILVLSLISTFTLVLGGWGCSKPVPAPAPAPSPAPAPAPKANPLAAIIEGAKKEGAVSVMMATKHGKPETLKALEKAIGQKYGVELRITYTNAGSMAPKLATAIMETKTRAVPTFDLLRFTTAYIPAGMKEGAFERVDWKPLLEQGASSEMVLQHPDLRGAIVTDSGMNVLIYNPQKVPAAEVPKKLSDLADPKWKGRLGITDFPDWVKWAFILGKDKTYATLRSIMNNKPFVGGATATGNRYLTGEIDLAFLPESLLEPVKEKGMPGEWRSLDFVDLKEYPLVVQTGSPHSNAAKLVAVYLASPEGMKFTVDVIGVGSHYSPGNHVYDAVMQAKKEGIPAYPTTEYPGLLDFILSPVFEQWQKEIELILKGA